MTVALPEAWTPIATRSLRAAGGWTALPNAILSPQDAAIEAAVNAHLDIAAINGMLKRQIRLAGSERAWSRAHGVPARSVSMFLNGERNPTPAILDALGIERQVTVTYRFKAGSNRNAA